MQLKVYEQLIRYAKVEAIDKTSKLFIDYSKLRGCPCECG